MSASQENTHTFWQAFHSLCATLELRIIQQSWHIMTASVGQILAFLYTQVTWRIPFPWSQHLEGGWMLEQCDSHCQQQSEILQQECDHTAGKATPHPSISAFQSSHCKCCAGNLKSLCWTKTLFFLFSILRRKKNPKHWWTHYFAKSYLGSWFIFHFKEPTPAQLLQTFVF